MKLEDKIKCRIPFGTISLFGNAIENIEEILKSCRLTNGEYVKTFEEEFAKYFGVKHAIAVSSGTDALTLALASLYDYGAKRGDEVIIPALTFVATANAVVNAGFKPVFVDVERDTLNINPNKIHQVITEKTRAIMPVHLMGKPFDIDSIKNILKNTSVFLIEDTAEAHGAKYKQKLCGTYGDIGCFSLYAAHIISSIEGGMIITNDNRTNHSIRSLRNHGLELQGSNWTFQRIGYSSKMNELEAAVGLENLKNIDYILDRRRKNLKILIENFNRDFKNFFETINEEEHEVIGPHAFPIVLKEALDFSKKEFVDYLNSKGIDNRNLFFSIPTQCPSYSYLGYRLGDFPNAEYISNNGTHIGVHQHLDEDDMRYVIDQVKNFIKDT